MSDDFSFDVFLCHAAGDAGAVRDAAERLHSDGLRVWNDRTGFDSRTVAPEATAAGLASSRVLVLFVSGSAFGPEWAHLEAQTFRFRDPLNRSRRFVLVRLDDTPIRESLAQFQPIDWRQAHRDRAYPELLAACQPPPASAGIVDVSTGRRASNGQSAAGPEAPPASAPRAHLLRMLDGHRGRIFAVALSASGTELLSADSRGEIRVWEVASGTCTRRISGRRSEVRELVFGPGNRIFAAYGDGDIGFWDLETGQTATLAGHTDSVHGLALSSDASLLVSGSKDGTIRVWDTATRACTRVIEQGAVWVNSIVILPGDRSILAAGEDGRIALWDLATGKRTGLDSPHTSWVWSIAYSHASGRMVSGSGDTTVGLWDVASRACVHVFEGHRNRVAKVAITSDGRWALSGSLDNTAIVWDLEARAEVATLGGHSGSVECVAMSGDGRLLVSGSDDRRLGVWRFDVDQPEAGPQPESVSYTNAKVLVVGDSHAGKTALTHRLATGQWKPSDRSTVGAWSTQLSLAHAGVRGPHEREVWLWDFGGQADQRLVHQLFMDKAAVVLLLFNADQEDVLQGLRDWQAALRRSVNEAAVQFLVAGRIDAGFKASRGKLTKFASDERFEYFETSALTGDGCDDLRAALVARIPWDRMETRTSPRIFKLIKDEILNLRDGGEVLCTFKELRELLRRRVGETFSDETLQAVVKLLDGPGVVMELDYGTYILLAPEWINVYAQAVIRTLRSADNDLGVLPLRSIADGKLIYQGVGQDGAISEVKRLRPSEERILLGEMERQLEQRGLCLRQGDKLVFPSHCGRDRPSMSDRRAAFVGYTVHGYLDDIYSTLVVRLADSGAFRLKELWRDAADFATLAGDHPMGIALSRRSASDGEISVHFGTGVTGEEQVIFASYIHSHIAITSGQPQRVRHYVCPHCGTPKGNSDVLRQKLADHKHKEKADTECDACGRRFPLWDALEKKFASETLVAEVARLKADDTLQLTSRRKGKLLVLEVGARITSANHKWMEVPDGEDDGIDIQVEFTDEAGNGIGAGLCLQLKAGNSHLTRRKDGVEIFKIGKPRWVDTWSCQRHPVMLVIGTFKEGDGRGDAGEKVEFADVRWMEIGELLKRRRQAGGKRVTQIEFQGERLDRSSIERWRRICTGAEPM